MYPVMREQNGEVLVEVLDRHVVPMPVSVRLSTTVVKAAHTDTEHLTFGDCFRILDTERVGLMAVGLKWCHDFSTHMQKGDLS